MSWCILREVDVSTCLCERKCHAQTRPSLFFALVTSKNVYFFWVGGKKWEIAAALTHNGATTTAVFLSLHFATSCGQCHGPPHAITSLSIVVHSSQCVVFFFCVCAISGVDSSRQILAMMEYQSSRASLFLSGIAGNAPSQRRRPPKADLACQR